MGNLCTWHRCSSAAQYPCLAFVQLHLSADKIHWFALDTTHHKTPKRSCFCRNSSPSGTWRIPARILSYWHWIGVLIVYLVINLLFFVTLPVVWKVNGHWQVEHGHNGQDDNQLAHADRTADPCILFWDDTRPFFLLFAAHFLRSRIVVGMKIGCF